MRVHLYNPKTEEESEQNLAMIFPDKMADALYRHDERVFQQVFFGERVNARDYWEHTRKFTPWINDHPSFRCTKIDKLIPISLYGDEVQSFRNTEGGVVSVLAWCSDFSAGLPALSRYLAICVVPDHYTTSRTFLDIWKLLAPRITRMCSDQVRHVWTSGGYQFTYSSTQGDLKWILEKFGFHNFRANNMCSWCECCKQHPDPGMTLGNFKEDAAHRQTRISHDEFFTKLGVAPAAFHPLFEIPGCRLERFLHDVCHSQLLGTGKVCNGSVLTYLAELGYFNGWNFGQYPVSMGQALRVAYCRFNEWKKQKGILVSQPRFTASRLHRINRTSYPSLSSKAAAGKAITFWLAECGVQYASRDGATELDKHVANCIWTYSEVLRLLDDSWYTRVIPLNCSFMLPFSFLTYVTLYYVGFKLCLLHFGTTMSKELPVLLSEEQANNFYKMGMNHLEVYAYLNALSASQANARGHGVINKALWMLLPKHHHFMHMLEDAKSSRINPAWYTLLCAESFIGHMGRLARTCHRASLHVRSLQRYKLMIALHFFKLR